MSGKIVCFCCGVTGHTKPNCKYKSLVCSNCSKVGHLKKVCKSKNKKSNVNLLEQVNNDLNDDFGDLNIMDNIYLLDSVDCNFIKPFNIKLNVEENLINFQIDTGSSITAISYDEFIRGKFKSKDLISSDISLKGYTGTLIEPVGFLRVEVLFKDHVVQNLKLYVIKGGGPPIVGRDWIDRLPLPKLSVTEVFYSRQVWLYNLTFVIPAPTQGPENCYLYTWTECDSGRGPNEVCSSLIDFLENLENRLMLKESPPTILNLFSDSCSGQNKNQFTMITLLYYINHRTTIFKQINHIFPVRGHSYMPPDRVFGRIEQVLRKKESIISPSQYYEIFKRFCTVKVYGKDFSIYDYKSVVKNLVKTKFDFKSTEQKIYTYTKGEKTVSKTYGGIPTKIEETLILVHCLIRLCNYQKLTMLSYLSKIMLRIC